MNKKVLFIQPYYFGGGHFFQSFNNLILNLLKFKNYDFLVSINTNHKEKGLLQDFKLINKKRKIFTFFHQGKSTSDTNVYKAFKKVFFLRKKYDVFFYYDINLSIISILHLMFNFLFKSKIIAVYCLFGPERIINSKIRLFFFRLFLRLNNIKIFTRTLELERSWGKKFVNFKNKINYIPSLDFPNIKKIKRSKSNKRKLYFGAVGQIRFGKSLHFLNDYFNKKNNYKFSIIGGYANEKAMNNFRYLNSKFLLNKLSFLNQNKIIEEAKKLDYIILLYDKFFDKRNEVSSLYLAAKLRIPIICFSNNNWLHKKVKIFKCGYTIKNLKQFSNFPSRNSNKYKSYLKGLKKLDNQMLEIKQNEKNLINSLNS